MRAEPKKGRASGSDDRRAIATSTGGRDGVFPRFYIGRLVVERVCRWWRAARDHDQLLRRDVASADNNNEKKVSVSIRASHFS